MAVSRLKVPQPIVKTISTNTLHPNPHNPRMLFDKAPLSTLRESIRKVGILVPLTVYRTKATGQWVILDGERRWMSAKELGLTKVPVNQVAEPGKVQNIVTMFQIHKLREDWELMPTALKLQVLMTELKEKRDRQLAELTGLDQAVVARCKKLLSFPKKYQDMMLVPEPSERIKADFFIELYPVLHDRNVTAMDWFKPEKFTSQMLERYETGQLKAVTDFRKVKQHITTAAKSGRVSDVSKRLREFSEKPEMKVEDLAIQPAAVAAKVREIEKATKALDQLLKRMNAQEFYGEEALWRQLEDLVDLIRLRLGEAERRPR